MIRNFFKNIIGDRFKIKRFVLIEALIVLSYWLVFLYKDIGQCEGRGISSGSLQWFSMLRIHMITAILMGVVLFYYLSKSSRKQFNWQSKRQAILMALLPALISVLFSYLMYWLLPLSLFIIALLTLPLFFLHCM